MNVQSGTGRSTKRSVRSNGKVKSGCLTCKTRKVKCDEGKPSCRKCVSTGRTCDGYGIWGGGGNGYAERYASAPRPGASAANNSIAILPIRAESTLTSLSAREIEQFDWFSSKFVTKLPCNFRFWKSLVLPAAYSEPAVMHAALALSSALRGKRTSAKEPIPDKQEQFTLQQYSKAIHRLRPHLEASGKAPAVVALITCLMFTYLEYFRGRHNAANSHLQNGLYLMKEMYSRDKIVYHGFNVSMIRVPDIQTECCIASGFSRMHTQAHLFGRPVAPRLPTTLMGEMEDWFFQPMARDVPTPVFLNVDEARDSLDKVLHAMLLLTDRLQTPKSEIVYSAVVSKYQPSAQNTTKIWLDTYNTTMKRSADTLSAIDKHTYKVLLVYRMMAHITTYCIWPGEQMKFDRHAADFLFILKQSKEMCENPEQEDWSPIGSAPSILDAGYIPPLYFTALKCRQPSIRRGAIDLLEKIPRREGIWDGNTAAKITRKVMALEERGFYRHVELDDGFIMSGGSRVPKTVPPLPEAYRFCDVQVESSDDVATTSVLACKRKMEDGGFAVERHKLE